MTSYQAKFRSRSHDAVIRVYESTRARSKSAERCARETKISVSTKEDETAFWTS
jgi:hypothetical protein